MKKEVNKIVLVIGFFVALVGTYISMLIDDITFISYIWNTTNIAIILAVTFVFSKNEIIKNIGYILALFVGATGTFNVLFNPETGILVVSIGYIIMAVGALIYYVIFILKFFGFVKVGYIVKSKKGAIIDELNGYADLKKAGLITDEEFDEIKQKLFNGSNNKKDSSMDDLKKWKKLFDQQIISESEFAEIKKDFLLNK